MPELIWTSTETIPGTTLTTNTGVPNTGSVTAGSGTSVTVPSSGSVTVPSGSSVWPGTLPPGWTPPPSTDTTFPPGWFPTAASVDKTNPYHFSLENEEVRRRWAAALVKEVFDTILEEKLFDPKNQSRRYEAELQHADKLLKSLNGRLLALEVLEPFADIGGEKRPDGEKERETQFFKKIDKKLEELLEHSDETIEMAPGVWKHAIEEIKKMLDTEEKVDE